MRELFIVPTRMYLQDVCLGCTMTSKHGTLLSCPAPPTGSYYSVSADVSQFEPGDVVVLAFNCCVVIHAEKVGQPVTPITPALGVSPLLCPCPTLSCSWLCSAPRWQMMVASVTPSLTGASFLRTWTP